jgi:hypothetical protein
MISRFAMDSSGEFLFGHNAHTLAAGLPYPSSVPVSAISTADADASNAFATALSLAQRVAMERGPFGAAWPLTEFWHDKIRAPMRIVHAFLDPILSDAVVRRKADGVEKMGMDGAAEDREVQEGETLVEHLLNYTDGMSGLGIFCELYLTHVYLWFEQIERCCETRL